MSARQHTSPLHPICFRNCVVMLMSSKERKAVYDRLLIDAVVEEKQFVVDCPSL